MTIDWTKPIEHVDGTPLRVVGDPDMDGDYVVRRKDGRWLTADQHPSASAQLSVYIDSATGGWWMDRNGPVLVRNRAEHTDDSLASIFAAGRTAGRTGQPREANPWPLGQREHRHYDHGWCSGRLETISIDEVVRRIVNEEKSK